MARLYKIIIYSGISAFFFLSAAFFIGVTNIGFEFHPWAGFLAFLFSSIHVVCIIVRKIKLRKGK